jgi:hypothetical protein
MRNQQLVSNEHFHLKYPTKRPHAQIKVLVLLYVKAILRILAQPQLQNLQNAFPQHRTFQDDGIISPVLFNPSATLSIYPIVPENLLQL